MSHSLAILALFDLLAGTIASSLGWWELAGAMVFVTAATLVMGAWVV